MPGLDRDQPPTARRLQQARDQGNLPISQDFRQAVVFFAAVLILQNTAGGAFHALQTLLAHNLSAIASYRELDYRSLLVQDLSSVGPFLLTLIAGVVVVACLATFIQTGLYWNPGIATPRLLRVQPLAIFRRVFSLQNFSEIFRSLFKVLLASLVVWSGLQGASNEVLRTIDEPLATGFAVIVGRISTILFQISLFFLVLGAVDYYFRRWYYIRSLRMTRQEVQLEMKDQEGDPQIRGTIRRQMMNRQRWEQLQRVPEATVVVTNPIHVAVALRYRQPKDAAPIVLAKGEGLWAQRIKMVARDHRIPVVENPPLAREIYRTVNVGNEIPARLYQAVAEVILWVYQLQGVTPR